MAPFWAQEGMFSSGVLTVGILALGSARKAHAAPLGSAGPQLSLVLVVRLGEGVSSGMLPDPEVGLRSERWGQRRGRKSGWKGFLQLGLSFGTWGPHVPRARFQGWSQESSDPHRAPQLALAVRRGPRPSTPVCPHSVPKRAESLVVPAAVALVLHSGGSNLTPGWGRVESWGAKGHGLRPHPCLHG